jgi:hypothetical protein
VARRVVASAIGAVIEVAHHVVASATVTGVVIAAATGVVHASTIVTEAAIAAHGSN